MSQRIKTHFQLSLLAAAVLSLSACSSTPKVAGVDLGKVGSKTAQISSNAWEGTKNLLNIGEPDSELLDEVDLALMEEDANMEDVQLTGLSSEPLLPQDSQGNPLVNAGDNVRIQPQTNDTPAKLAFGEVPQAPELNAVEGGAKNGEIVVMANFKEELPAPSAKLDDELFAEGYKQVVPTTDLTHEVAENETLWVIAKRTTGDANNWHVIADINNLAPDASVYAGQKLIIPADMVKPEYSGVAGAVETEVVSAPVIVKEEPAAVALKIPEQPADAKPAEQPAEVVVVAASAEQITPSAPAASAKPVDENILANATALKVAEGETLWDFAKRTTGDATNWKTLADKNLLTEQQIASIRPGQKIYVPSDMVVSRDENGVLIAQGGETGVPTATAGGVTQENKAAIDASTAVLAGTNKPEDANIKIVEAAYQDDTAIKPVTAESLAEEASMEVASNDKLGKVMVRGTYYPKAVYNEADFSSSLLMRVSPGTQLLVSKAIGPWLEVKTDKGVGYVHSRDIK